MLDLGLLVLKVLAVVGGAAVGAVVVGVVLKLLVRLTTTRPVPRPALLLSRLLGAVAAGLAVYLWIAGEGLGGMGGGGGGLWPFGQKGGSGEAKSATKDAKPEVPKSDKLTPEEVVRVQMRGGKDAEADQRFYSVDGQSPQNLDEVQQTLRARLGKVKAIEIVIGKGSVDKDSPAVTALTNWAKDQGLMVKTVEP